MKIKVMTRAAESDGTVCALNITVTVFTITTL